MFNNLNWKVSAQSFFFSKSNHKLVGDLFKVQDNLTLTNHRYKIHVIAHKAQKSLR